MTWRPSARVSLAAMTGLLLVVAALLFRRECAFGGGMPGWYRDCTCRGLERVDYDHTPADGPRRTVCFGLVTARTCYRYQGGPVVPCDSLPRR
jgi:hypothetical protein